MRTKKPQIQHYIIFPKCSLPQISTFSLGQKGCAYYGKSAYYEFAQYISY